MTPEEIQKLRRKYLQVCYGRKIFPTECSITLILSLIFILVGIISILFFMA